MLVLLSTWCYYLLWLSEFCSVHRMLRILDYWHIFRKFDFNRKNAYHTCLYDKGKRSCIKTAFVFSFLPFFNEMIADLLLFPKKNLLVYLMGLPFEVLLWFLGWFDKLNLVRFSFSFLADGGCQPYPISLQWPRASSAVFWGRFYRIFGW